VDCDVRKLSASTLWDSNMCVRRQDVLSRFGEATLKARMPFNEDRAYLP